MDAYFAELRRMQLPLTSWLKLMQRRPRQGRGP